MPQPHLRTPTGETDSAALLQPVGDPDLALGRLLYCELNHRCLNSGSTRFFSFGFSG